MENTKMDKYSFTSKDSNWQDECVHYWFHVDGDEYGVVENSDGSKQIVDSENCPVNTDDAGYVHLNELFALVTDEMRVS